MTDLIKSHWPLYSKDEIQAVQAVLQSGKVNYWTGDEGRKFEHEFAQFCNARFAVAVANGSVAIELALRALNIGIGDEVIVTSRTFIASASSIVMVGATPVFADVDPDTQNITVNSVEAVLSPRVKAIIAVHLAGWPCDMDPLMSLALQYDLKVIEDCAQAHGARYKGHSVGSIGHVAAWSFCQDKIMSTGGEGGMVTTNDDGIWEKVWSYKDHGKSWNAVFKSDHPPGFRWLHESFGTNWRMTEMQSAIGRMQIRKMPVWHAARTRNAEKILGVCELFPNILRVPKPPIDIVHAYYKCYVFVRPAGFQSGWSRQRIIDEITSRGVPCLMGSCSEVYLEKAFDGTEFRPRERLFVARQLGETSLMFLVHPSLTHNEINFTCSVINEVMSMASS